MCSASRQSCIRSPRSSRCRVVSTRIRVLIVDDSSIQRQLLREALSTESDIEVISHAANGRLALPRVKHLGPDIVVLDQEMPEMNGIETLQEIRKESPATGVIMYCARLNLVRLTLCESRKGKRILSIIFAVFLCRGSAHLPGPSAHWRRPQSPLRRRLYCKRSSISAPLASRQADQRLFEN